MIQTSFSNLDSLSKKELSLVLLYTGSKRHIVSMEKPTVEMSRLIDGTNRTELKNKKRF